MTKISVDTLTIDSRLQHRTDARSEPNCANPERAAAYAELIRDGLFVPKPIKVMQVGKIRYIWSGFHTLAAQVLLGKNKVEADVEKGTFEEALQLSCSLATDNAAHGAPYTQGDKKLILTALYQNPEWLEKPLDEVAKFTGISRSFCGVVRSEVEAPPAAAATPAPAEARTSEDEQPVQPKRKLGRPAGRKNKAKPGANGKAKGKKKDRDEEAGKDVREDAVGHPLPERLHDVFTEKHRLTAIADTLALYRSQLSNLASWAVHLPVAKADDALEAAERAIRDGIPHAVCPDCSGLGEDCNLCLNSGYLNEPTYTDITAEMAQAK